MNYIKEIVEKLHIVNEVLNEIKTSGLLENVDFFVDEMSMETWLKINLKGNDHNKVPLSFTFTLTGLEIRLDRIIEAIDWSNEDLKNSRALIKSMLKNILTCYILVEYFGPSRTRISLFGQDGRCTNNFKYSEGFSFMGKKEDRLYFPIYSL